jgi:hypothetical protein
MLTWNWKMSLTGDKVVSRNLNNINFFFFWKLWKLDKEPNITFFLKDLMIAQKRKYFMLFTLLINIEWIIASLVHMGLIHKYKINKR